MPLVRTECGLVAHHVTRVRIQHRRRAAVRGEGVASAGVGGVANALRVRRARSHRRPRTHTPQPPAPRRAPPILQTTPLRMETTRMGLCLQGAGAGVEPSRSRCVAVRVCVCVCVRVRVRCAGVCVSLHGPTCRPMLPTQSATTSPRTHARGRVRGGTAPARAAVPATRPQTTGAPSHPTPTPTPVATAAAPVKEAQSEARVAVPATAASNTAHSEAAARRGSSSGSSGLQPAEAIVERLRARNMVGVHCCLAQVASVGAAVATLKFAGRESWLEQLVRHKTHCCAGMSTAIARR